MSINHQTIIAVALSLFLTPAVYGQENPCVQNPGSMACLCQSNPKNLACACEREPDGRACVCAQSCGLTTLTTHAEALTHPGYALCYKKGVVPHLLPWAEKLSCSFPGLSNMWKS